MHGTIEHPPDLYSDLYLHPHLYFLYLLEKRDSMNVTLLVTFVALSLLYGVQGEAQCIKVTGVNSFCGCQLKDSSNNTVINIKLDFIVQKYAKI